MLSNYFAFKTKSNMAYLLGKPNLDEYLEISEVPYELILLMPFTYLSY